MHFFRKLQNKNSQDGTDSAIWSPGIRPGYVSETKPHKSEILEFTQAGQMFYTKHFLYFRNKYFEERGY
jgi:hypothetical protein